MFAGRPIIGLAGGIGAGKSTVARLFEPFGCCVIASDAMVAAAYTHPAVKREVATRFGEDVLDPQGRIDRKRIAGIVFRDADQRLWLEKLLHPIANQARMELMDQAAKDPTIVAYIWDSPLLFETRLNELCDATVFVDAPLEDRARRVAGRGWDAQELARRENVQFPLDKKREMSDYRVYNGDVDPATPAAVEVILRQILEQVGLGGSSCCEACGSGCGEACGGRSSCAKMACDHSNGNE